VWRLTTARYLDPHESEDQQILAGFNRQKDALDEAQSKLISAANYACKTAEYASAVAKRLNMAATGRSLD
jgi:hypothetical protein